MATTDKAGKGSRPRTPRLPNVGKLLSGVERKYQAFAKKQAQLDAARDELQAAVDQARAAGAVWQEIADATGLASRQVAEIKFSAEGRKRNSNRSKS